jgi:hypothetical protein
MPGEHSIRVLLAAAIVDQDYKRRIALIPQSWTTSQEEERSKQERGPAGGAEFELSPP